MPSGKVAQPDITDNKDGTVTVRYAPSEAGLHEMDIRYDNMHIPGEPHLWGGETLRAHQGTLSPLLFQLQEAPCSFMWIMSTVVMSRPTGLDSHMGL